MKIKMKKGTKKSIRKLSAPEPQRVRGRDGGNDKFRALSDEYTPEVTSNRILVKEYHSNKGGNVKVYLICKVQRFDSEDGEGLGLPYVFIQMYQESEKPEGYTGYQKGKSVHFPLEMMYDVQDLLMEVSDTCDRLKIE